MSENNLPLAVITVTYSPGEHLKRFIDSVGENAYIILADNGSTDGVPQAAVSESVEFLDTGGNIGYGSGMNAGVRRALELAGAAVVRPDFFLLVNPDVVFQPGAIDALLECAQRNPRAGAVGPRIEEPDGSVYPSARAVPTIANGVGHALFADIWPSNPWSKRYRSDNDLGHERSAGWLSGACLLVRRDAFLEVGGFDERYFMYMEDVDLGDRLSKAGWSSIFCPTAVINHAQGHSTKQHSAAMLRAHHRSAYRFQADRHPHWWQAPLRWALRIGLGLRAKIAVAVSRS